MPNFNNTYQTQLLVITRNFKQDIAHLQFIGAQVVLTIKRFI